MELKQLDPVRVTLMRLPNGIRQITTDRYDAVVPASKSSWTGMTIYQINGATRKELAMFSTAPAKKVARQAKHAIIKKKPTSELNERGLTMMEREQFMQAKIKELKSLGVCSCQRHGPTTNSYLKNAAQMEQEPGRKSASQSSTCGPRVQRPGRS